MSESLNEEAFASFFEEKIMENIELFANQREYRIVNHSGSMLSYGANFEIERKVEGEWRSILPENRPCILILYHLAPNSSESYQHHIHLEKGEYRLSKRVSKLDSDESIILTCEFEVNDN